MSARKGRLRKVYPAWRTKTETSYQQMRRRLRYSTIFCLSLHWQHLSSPLPSWWTARWGPGGNAPPTVGEDQVHKHLRNRNVLKSMGPDEKHPESCGNWLMPLPSHSLWYLKGHGSQAKSVVTGRREIWSPLLKRVESRTLGTSDLSASPLCLGRSWKRSS